MTRIFFLITYSLIFTVILLIVGCSFNNPFAEYEYDDFTWTGGDGADVDLTNYYTKSDVNKLLLNIKNVNVAKDASIDQNKISGGTFGFVPYINVTKDVSIDSTFIVKKLIIGGKYIFPTLDGSVGQVLKTDGNGLLSWQSNSSEVGGDDLGNHIASKNITLGNFWLSEDGSNNGIHLSNSNIGIGTSTPGYKLDVNGSLRISTGSIVFPDGTSMNSAGTGSANALSNNEDIIITADADTNGIGKISMNIGESEKMIILNDGKIGIGTTSPLDKFSIGLSSQFCINSTGNIIRINNVATSFPLTQGAVNTVLTNNGSGILTWSVPSTSPVSSVFGRTGTIIAAENDYNWSQIDKTTSSLADITTRSAGDLSSGNLAVARMPTGGNWNNSSDLNIQRGGTNRLTVTTSGITVNGALALGNQANKATITYTTNTARIYTIPDVGTSNFVMTEGNQTINGTKTFGSSISGSITGNAATATVLHTARTINGTSFNGSANITISANTTNTLTRGTYLTGSNFNGSAATTWAVDATSANTASKVVARDASGNFSAGTITANLSGNLNNASSITMNSAFPSDSTYKIQALNFGVGNRQVRHYWGNSYTDYITFGTGYNEVGNKFNNTYIEYWGLTGETNTWFEVRRVNTTTGVYTTALKLDHNANATFGGSITVNSLITNGAVYSNAGLLTNTNPSSREYKKDIKDIDLKSKRLLDLKPKSFVWKNNNQKDIGYIAEEIKDTIPELYIDDGITKGFDIAKLPFYIVELIKVQHTTIEKQKEELILLNKKIRDNRNNPFTIFR